MLQSYNKKSFTLMHFNKPGIILFLIIYISNFNIIFYNPFNKLIY